MMLRKLKKWWGHLGEYDDDEALRQTEEYGFWLKVIGMSVDLRREVGRLQAAGVLLGVCLNYTFCLYIGIPTITTALLDRIDISFLILAYLAIYLIGIFILFTILGKRPQLCNFHKQMARGFWNYDVEVPVNDSKYKRIHKFVKKEMNICLFVACVAVTFGSQMLRREENSHLGGIDLRLIIPLVYPTKLGWLGLALANLHMMLTGLWVILAVIWGVHFTLNFLLTWIKEMERLLASVEGIEERAVWQLRGQLDPTTLHQLTSDKDLLYWDDRFVDAYNSCIKENVQHHIALKSYLQLGQSLLELPLTFSIFSGSGIFAAIISILTDNSDGSASFNTKLHTGLVFLICFSIALGLCLVAQNVNDLSEELQMAIYNTEWRLAHPRIRKNILILMEVLRQPARPVLMKIVVYDLKGFVFMVNTTFTFYNILLMTRGLEVDVL